MTDKVHPSAPQYSQQGPGEVNPQPYAPGGVYPADVGAANPPPPPYAAPGAQPIGVAVAHSVPSQHVIGGPQLTVVGPHPIASPNVAVTGTQPAVLVAPTTVIVGTTYADTPVSCTCPVCQQRIVTRIQHSNGLLVWAIFGVLLLFGCWLGCCLIPFCVDGCKDVDHYCSNCNHHLSKYKRM
ncbi:hypothetical protein GDO81_016981 [Engystomops pustulosus]|uniref:LITAF domain-containing protein n=1 Tax=Engystomops pustulosus TaxID=76066 RepID=A0AAV7AAT2_ENGPU|nr:hypothetical protein GDO81_016981 [Engystomops pustulosus]